MRVGTRPFILRGVTLHESRCGFERFIGRCMANKISLIYNANYSEIFTFFQQDDENKLTTCVSIVLSRYFRCFGLFMPSLFFKGHVPTRTAVTPI